MTNRMAAAGAAVLAVLAASGCGAVPKSGVAASVGDDEITVEQVEQVMRDVTQVEGFGVVADEATGTIDAAVARQIVSLLVTNRATHSFLAANGESITDEDRQPILDGIAEDDPSRQAPDVLNLLVDFEARDAAVARVSAAPPADLQARYEGSPGERGVVCVRHVLLDTEGEAQDVIDELAAGAAIEDLAAERSTDPSAATNGGAIELTPGQPCVTVDEARQNLVGPFVDAAVTAVPGEPVGPVETDFGWHVIEARPYDEVAESLDAIAGQLAFSDYVRDLDVEVDPRYGRWDPAAGAVVPLS